MAMKNFSSSIRQPSGGTTIPARKEISGASGDTAVNSNTEASSATTVNTKGKY